MKAVTYITENTIMKFLYNPKKTSLEGFVKEGLRFDSGVYKDYGKYVRFLKVPIRDNVSELYMQGYPWETQKGCKDRPLGYIDNAAEFERVAVIIDSSKIWPLVGSSSIEAFLAICPELQNILWSNNFLCGFWREFPQRVFEEFNVDESAENNEDVKSLAMQYVIFDALTNSDSPLSFECMLNALKGTCTYECMNDYECAIDYGCDPEGCITSMVQWLNDKHQKGSIPLWLSTMLTNFSARPFPKPSLAPLRSGRLQSVQTASACRFRQAVCTTADRVRTCRTAITPRSNSAICLRRSRSFCRMPRMKPVRCLPSMGMSPLRL